MTDCNNTAVACTLDAAAVAGRLAEWAELLGRGVDHRRIEGGWSIGFAADPPLIGRLADVAVREHQCCAFFSFAIVVDGSQVRLEARAPETAQPLLDELLNLT
jgi:hypothetical protein